MLFTDFNAGNFSNRRSFNLTYWLSSTILKNLQKLSTRFEFDLSKINIFLSVYHQQMLVQGPTSILISNYHHIITFFHHFLTFFKEKSTFLRILITTKWWSFDHHFPPSLVMTNLYNTLSKN